MVIRMVLILLTMIQKCRPFIFATRQQIFASTTREASDSALIDRKQSVFKKMFITLNNTVLCSSPCIILKAPTPSGFDIDAVPMDRPYTHEYDDLLTSEIEFAKLHEHRNKFRLNKFIGGRIALRFVLP